MRGVLPRIRAAGAELVVIGNGPAHFARGFRDELGLDFPLYTDPTLATHAVMGLRRSVAASFSPKAVLSAVRALRGGHRQSSTQGDPWQQGGVFVLRAPAEEAFAYVSEAAGDHPPVDAVLGALGCA